MNRPIKFRGRICDENKARDDQGEFVFGSYCYEDYGKRDARLGILHAIIDEGGEEFIVDADSIAQLVGYDKNGREVYEGDTLIDQFGFESQAWLAKSFHDDCKLKEDTK